MDFQLLGDVKDIEPIAVNLSIRERKNSRPASAGIVGGSSKAWRWSGSPTVKFATLRCIGMRPMAWVDAR